MTFDLFQCECECGCAAKVPAGQLRDILSDLDLPASPSLVIGPETLDDAGVYRISEDLWLIQTVDYFPPVARDPYQYGQIAAANSLSDVYAMGGKPHTALAIVCFPAQSLPFTVLKEITRGAVDKLREAGTVLLGGHSVVDPLPKYGLAVTGSAQPDRIMDNAHAQPGDLLVLTKPLGTGVTIMAVKAKLAQKEQEDEVNRVMTTLNATAADAACSHSIRSCTDVTGFGLLGHAHQMAQASGVGMELWIDAMPMLDCALNFTSMGLLSQAAYSNRNYVGEQVRFDSELTQAPQDLLFDPQTSGGLLMACPETELDGLLADMKVQLDTSFAVIGRVTEPSQGARICVTKTKEP